MAGKREGGKGFCPFCGMEFAGNHDNCPFCGQDIRRYKDDLGPIMGTIQTATNIDMKGPRARVAMAIIVALMIIAGGLVVFDYYEKNIVVPSDVPPEAEGIMIEIQNNGYIDLTGDFANRDLILTPQYDPELKVVIKLNDKYNGRYEKAVWIVQTEVYSDSNLKNPFYQKVTKEGTGLTSVTWENVTVGRFLITADCYTKEGDCDVFSGQGVYYGAKSTDFTWIYNEKEVSFDYTMPLSDVITCLEYDLDDRVAQQAKHQMKDHVLDSESVNGLVKKLKSLYNRNYKYSDAGFADFVLSFVQSNFPDVPDSVTYHVDDYWAYPAETIMRGCGDDEDRAILYCALMLDIDLNVALLSLPGTTIAAVNVDLSESFIGTYAKTVKGKPSLYTVADTTSSLRLGMLRDNYDVSDDGKTLYFNGEELPKGDYLTEIKA